MDTYIMSGAAISAEVAAAIRAVGAEVGAGTFEATIFRDGPISGPVYDPIQGAPVAYQVAVIDSNINVRDDTGTLVGETRRMLTIEAGVVEPLKGDIIKVRGVNYTIADLQTVAPLGVDLLYKATLEVGGYVAPMPIPIREFNNSFSGAFS